MVRLFGSSCNPFLLMLTPKVGCVAWNDPISSCKQFNNISLNDILKTSQFDVFLIVQNSERVSRVGRKATQEEPFEHLTPFQSE